MVRVFASLNLVDISVEVDAWISDFFSRSLVKTENDGAKTLVISPLFAIFSKIDSSLEPIPHASIHHALNDEHFG